MNSQQLCPASDLSFGSLVLAMRLNHRAREHLDLILRFEMQTAESRLVAAETAVIAMRFTLLRLEYCLDSVALALCVRLGFMTNGYSHWIFQLHLFTVLMRCLLFVKLLDSYLQI